MTSQESQDSLSPNILHGGKYYTKKLGLCIGIGLIESGHPTPKLSLDNLTFKGCVVQKNEISCLQR
jgi:hypothetical protein